MTRTAGVTPAHARNPACHERQALYMCADDAQQATGPPPVTGERWRSKHDTNGAEQVAKALTMWHTHHALWGPGISMSVANPRDRWPAGKREG